MCLVVSKKVQTQNDENDIKMMLDVSKEYDSNNIFLKNMILKLNIFLCVLA